MRKKLSRAGIGLFIVVASSTLVLAARPELMPWGGGLMERGPVMTKVATGDVVVQIAPHTLLLSAEQSGSVIVHAEIAYCDVVAASVTLEGIPARSTKADLRGELVAYFDEVAVKAIATAPRTTLTLTGATVGGGDFSGCDTVQVRP